MKKMIILIISIAFNLTAQIPDTLSPAEKVYGLSRFWQEVNYNFVYLDKIDRDQWEQDYIHLISEVQKTENDYEYYRLLQKLCASLKDGHTNVYFPENVQKNIYQTSFGVYRLFLTHIDGKAVVTRINLGKKDEIPIGTEIIKVNGIKTKEYLERKVMPYISSSAEHILKNMAVSRMFAAPAGTSFDVVFKLPEGKIKELKLTLSESPDKEFYPEFEEFTLFEFRWIDEEIAYISLNSFGSGQINTLFEEKLPELYNAEKLIIDLRKNGGGSTATGRDILKYLTKDEQLYGARMYSRQHIPYFKAWGSWTDVKDTTNNEWAAKAYLSYHDQYYYEFPYEPYTVKTTARRIAVPTAVLIGHHTGSAAEDFLIFADNQKHMIKIGEPTFGSTGQPLLIELPGGGSARICTKKDIYPDGREFVGYGIQPDIFIKRTLDDYLNHTDPVLEEAIKFLRDI